MNIFNPKDDPELLRLGKENEELRNTIHNILSRQEASSDLETKIEELTEKLSELAKEEQRIEDFIESTTIEKVEKSKIIFELNKQMGELTQKKEQLENNQNFLEKSNIGLAKKTETSELKNTELTSKIAELSETIKLKEGDVTKLETKLSKLSDAAKKTEAKIASEEDKTKILKETFAGLSKEIKQNKVTIVELETTITEKERSKLKSEYNTEALNKTLEILEEKKELFSEDIQLLESKISGIKEEHSSVTEQLKNDELIRRNMQTNIAELISELNSKEKVFKEYATKKEKFVDDISQKRNELDNIKYETKNRKETLDSLNKEIENLLKAKREIDITIENKKSVVQDIEKKLIRKKEEESSLEDQFAEIKNNILDSEEKKFKVEENILQLESSFSDTTKKFAEEVNEAKAKLTSIKQLIIEKDRDFNKKEKIFLERNTQLAEYTGMVRLFKKEKESIENSIKDLKSDRERLNEKIISLREQESARKITIENYTLETQDLIKRRDSISEEITIILEKSSKAYNEYHNKNKSLTSVMEVKEATIKELSDKINEIELTLVKLKDELSKAEIEKEEHSTNISQLVTMEKTFKSKVENYKKELERIEDESVLETLVKNVKITPHKVVKKNIKLENN